MSTKIHKGKKAKPYPSDHATLKMFMSYNADSGMVTTFGPYKGTPRENYNGYTILKLPHNAEKLRGGKRDTHYYRVDHLAWMYCTGEWPSGWIEHVNGILSDNAIENLVHLDDEGRRWWYGSQLGDDIRRLVRVDSDPTFNGPATEMVTIEGNDDERQTFIRPRVSEGWAQRVVEVEKEDTIEPMDDNPKGEFGVDWT